MKKVLSYLGIALAAMIVVGAALMLISKDSLLHKAVFGNGKEQMCVEKELFDAHSLERIKNAVQKYGLESDRQEFYEVYDVPAFGAKAEYIYLIDSDDQVQYVKAYVLLFDYLPEEDAGVEEYNAEQLRDAINVAFDKLGEINNTQIGDNYFIFSGADRLDCSSIDSFEKLRTGEAHIEFLMRDADRHYFKVSTERMPDNAFFFEIERFYYDEQFVNSVPNIVVE